MPAPAQLVSTIALSALIALGLSATARAAAPTPCGGAAQISDIAGDGHHNTTDVTGAWFAEEPGSLRAVIQVVAGNWASDHEDDGSLAAQFALIYTVGGEQRFVRVIAPPTSFATPVTFDYGVWHGGGDFQSLGATTGSVTHGPSGYAVIDVPALPAGTVVTHPFVLTWDGYDAGAPHWIDRAPGGAPPSVGGYGADFVVGTCLPGALDPATILATQLDTMRSVTGARTVEFTGRVLPAQAGARVALRLKAKSNRTLWASTEVDGSFSLKAAIRESTVATATAGGRASGAVKLLVRSRTRIKVRRSGGRVVVSGTTNPALPGTVMLVRDGDYRSTAHAKAHKGRFTFRLRSPRKGTYEAVYVPQKGRAERSTSNKGLIR